MVVSENLFFIAQISSTVSKEGYLLLKNYFDSSKKVFGFKYVFVDVFGDKRKFFVEDFYFSGEQPVIKFKNFDTIEDVNFLIKHEVFVEKENFVNDDSDEFFASQFIGSQVFKGDKFFGKLIDVENYPGNDVLNIQDENGKEILVPVVKAFIDRIDKEKKVIYLNPEIDLDYDEV